MQGGFTGTGKADIVRPVSRGQLAADFVKNGRGGHVFPALDGVGGGMPELAVPTVKGTGLDGQVVHTQRAPEAAGGHRSVDMVKGSRHGFLPAVADGLRQCPACQTSACC